MPVSLTVPQINSFEICRQLVLHSRPPRKRTMREFAEEEIVVPNGPYAGRRFRCKFQPYAGLLFDEIDSGRWKRFAIVGPTQTGKTLCAHVIPMLYYLFEWNETVIAGIPTKDIVQDKWKEDINPVLEKTRYRVQKPAKGRGSKGGEVLAVKFSSGATLRFMTGGGNDKARSAYTSRILCVTETDGMDEPGKTSREADKISQLEGRTKAFAGNARIFLECTASVEKGRIWQEYKNGSQSRIATPCSHCGQFVTLERENLVGWEGAESLLDARDQAAWECSECQTLWSESDRRQANQNAVLLHAGQEVVDGEIVGDLPRTNTLGFRWSAVNNLFATAGDVAMELWTASQAEDEENAEKKIRQFTFALPYEPPEFEQNQITAQYIRKRDTTARRGIIGDGVQYVTAAADIGQRMLHWLIISWDIDARGIIFDYGVIEIKSDSLGLEVATLVALREFRDQMLEGYPAINRNHNRIPDRVVIDSSWHETQGVVYAFIKETNAMEGHRNRFLPVKGYGETQDMGGRYNSPKALNNQVRHIGEEYHISWIKGKGIFLFVINSDHWKDFGQKRFLAPPGDSGSMILYRAGYQEHQAIAKHLTAEEKTSEFKPGHGMVTTWKRKRAANHWFDCYYMSCAAGHLCGVRLINSGLEQALEDEKTRLRANRIQRKITTPDGRAYLATDRR